MVATAESVMDIYRCVNAVECTDALGGCIDASRCVSAAPEFVIVIAQGAFHNASSLGGALCSAIGLRQASARPLPGLRQASARPQPDLSQASARPGGPRVGPSRRPLKARGGALSRRHSGNACSLTASTVATGTFTVCPDVSRSQCQLATVPTGSTPARATLHTVTCMTRWLRLSSQRRPLETTLRRP
jgi:hypothetical protein